MSNKKHFMSEFKTFVENLRFLIKVFSEKNKDTYELEKRLGSITEFEYLFREFPESFFKEEKLFSLMNSFKTKVAIVRENREENIDHFLYEELDNWLSIGNSYPSYEVEQSLWFPSNCSMCILKIKKHQFWCFLFYFYYLHTWNNLLLFFYFCYRNYFVSSRK